MKTERRNLRVQAENQVPSGSTWEHFEGGEYLILGHELDGETTKEGNSPTMIVHYQQQYDDERLQGQILTMPLSDFLGTELREGGAVPKFSQIQEAQTSLIGASFSKVR